MKKLLISLIFLSFISSYSQKQNKTTFGIKGGYNNSIVDGFELDGTKTGFLGRELYISFFADTELNNKWNIENEILFSYTDDYHFIEIPIHIKYKIIKKWSVFLGPKLDFIIDNDNNDFEAINYRFNNFGISGELGIQYNFTKRFFVETRYSRSFTSQVDDLTLEIFEGKRHTFRIGLGIRF